MLVSSMQANRWPQSSLAVRFISVTAPLNPSNPSAAASSDSRTGPFLSVLLSLLFHFSGSSCCSVEDQIEKAC